MNRYDQFAEVQNQWTAPRELQRSTPRPVHLSALGVFLAVMGIILFLGAIAGGVLLSAESIRQTRNYRILGQEGRATDATISRLWRSGDKGKSAHVEYWFDFEGRRNRNDATVPLRIWRTLEKGEKLPVRFVPSNPQVNHPSDWQKRPFPIWVAWAAAVFLAVFPAIIAIALRRQIDLLAEGRPAPAVVTQVRRVHHSHGGHATIVRYEFRTMSGGIERGKSNSAGKDKKAGDKLCVLYDPNDPRRNAVYPPPMVRVMSH